MEDPVVGGYTPDKIALRRAIGMAYDQQDAIRVVLKGRAVPAKSPIPPDIAGYDPNLKTKAQLFDPAAARALLDRFGYKDRDGDGYRETPDGKPLTIERWSTPNSVTRQSDELWKKNMDAIGLRIVFKKDRTPELRKMARLGKIPTRADGWNADYPDAENFMQLLYGPTGQENNSRFDLPAFNKLYEQARALPDSPARTKLFDQMTELMLAYAPWRMGYHLIEDQLLQPWVRDYKPHPIRSQTWQYVDLDPRRRQVTALDAGAQRRFSIRRAGRVSSARATSTASSASPSPAASASANAACAAARTSHRPRGGVRASPRSRCPWRGSSWRRAARGRRRVRAGRDRRGSSSRPSRRR